jgi:hypothetical protein
MYKAFIEPDLKTAHIKITNKFNPFSGFQSPTYILKVIFHSVFIYSLFIFYILYFSILTQPLIQVTAVYALQKWILLILLLFKSVVVPVTVFLTLISEHVFLL